MSPVGSELAVQRLTQLGSELREQLQSLERKLADLEAEGVVRRSRIDELTSSVQQITKKGLSEEVEIDPEKEEAELRSILDRVVIEGLNLGQREKLAEAFSGFRSQLMSALNEVDLVSSALRKAAKSEEEKAAQQQKVQIQNPRNPQRSVRGSSAIIRSQEIERHKIAREIHDGPAQAIANVVLRMDILSKIYEKDPTEVPNELARMKKIAQGALDEIRGFIFDLRPMTLQDLGLVATIKRIVQSLKDLENVSIRFVVEGKERPLGQLVTLTVFRIAQEALTNMKKHSQCETAWVHLKYLPNKLILIVEDDGVGFDADEVERDQKKYISFGLVGMNERAEDIGAGLEISSRPGDGTKVVLVVPTELNPAIEATLAEEKG